MKALKNNKGVALMLVLGSILILSTMVVEFAYNAHVSYELAASERDRLKAYYLARSGYSLVKLELKYEKDMRSRYASLLKDMKGTGVTADPLCKQIPLSTGLLKGIESGDLFGGAAGDQKKEGDTGTAGDEKEKDKTKEEKERDKKMEASKESAAAKVSAEGVSEETKTFLDFDGDFEVSCDTEERKLNLNIFREPATGAPPAPTPPRTPATPASAATPPPAPADTLSLYDAQKELLFSLLTQKDYEDIFKGKPDEARKLVNNIADWADRDDRINEGPGISGGAEDSLYTGDEYHYKVKNGRFASVPEVLLVAGMTDDIFQKLEPEVTVYGDSKINLCQASDGMVKAFIDKYIRTSPASLAPISAGDDEKWNGILNAVKVACNDPQPQPATVAQAIGPLIGATDTSGLATLITTANRFYRIESSATVGESKIRLIAVIDAGSSSPNLWKILYFRVE